MNIVKPSYEILEQQSGLQGIYKQIELAGRTCYKSHNKITEGSAEKFVDDLVKSNHTAMLEHGTVYLFFPIDVDIDNQKKVEKYERNPYSKCTRQGQYVLSKNGYYVTTNYRVLVENNWLDDLKYLCEPTKYHYRRYTVKFTADIHFYKDLTRHRVFSWAIESTRFCNYMKEKFNMSVNFMHPSWIKAKDLNELAEDCKTIESIYFKWINKGYQAQHAAYFLAQGTKAEVVMTGFTSDYDHLFNLRVLGTTGESHPDVKSILEPLYNEFKARGYLKL